MIYYSQLFDLIFGEQGRSTSEGIKRLNLKSKYDLSRKAKRRLQGKLFSERCLQEFLSDPCHFLAVWFWASSTGSLSLGFLICQMGAFNKGLWVTCVLWARYMQCLVHSRCPVTGVPWKEVSIFFARNAEGKVCPALASFLPNCDISICTHL